MDFAGAYVQEKDLLSELLGDEEDPKDIYKKSYYNNEGESYDNDKIKTLYSNNEEDSAYTEDSTYNGGYSSDEFADLSNIHSGAYSDNFVEEAGYNEDEKKSEEPGELPVSAKSTLNFGNTGMLNRGLSKIVSAPVVNLKNQKQEYQKKDWNKAFQAILEEEESESKYQRLSQIAHEFSKQYNAISENYTKSFIFVAETYGKVIISEINVPVDQKTIKPISIGGQAGGEKYMAQGILFKFALDVGNLYGGNDEYAQKAAGHDLKGLIQYSLANIPGLHFPLMSLIHYMGYCLIAMSLLPIGKDSLKYGSSDAGKTMHFDIPAINEKMRLAGEALNLKGHIAGLSKYQSNLCYGPGDIECHLGKDNRFYVLDFARTFPPEAVLQDTLAEKGQILFKLLRPELVKRSRLPLSSDAFTGFGMSDPLHKTHNREVTEATQLLFMTVIPEFVDKAQKNGLNVSAMDGNLIKEIHKEGINVRHLGLVRRLFTDNAHHLQCLVEMVARVIKNKLKRQWRAITKVNQHITEEQCKQVSVVVLNKLYSDSEESTTFWTQKMPKYLHKKFRYALFASEKDVDLRDVLKNASYAASNLLGRIQQVTGILLSPTAWKDFRGFKSMTFVHSDIDRIQPVIKNMHIVDVADTQLLLWNGIKSEGRESERIFSLALEKIEQNSFLVTLQINKMLKIVYQLYQKAKKDVASISMNLAGKLLDSIIRLQPKTETAYILYAKLRQLQSHRDAGLEKLQEGLTALPDSVALHCEYLKKTVHNLCNVYQPTMEEEDLAAQKNHFEVAVQEGYLKGVASAYYAALLLLVGNESHQPQALELLTVAQRLMPQKFVSVLKLIVSRFNIRHAASPFQLLVPIRSLVTAQFFEHFDSVIELTSSQYVTDAVLSLVATAFLKLSEVKLQKTETLSSTPIVNLLQSRAESLRALSLTGFDDLSTGFITALQKCKALTALHLNDSNVKLADILTVLEHVPLKVLHIPAIKEFTSTSLMSALSFANIQDLNITNASLSKEELTAVLDNANVTRLFLDGIESLDLDMVKTYLARNNKITCFSAARCPLPEIEVIQALYQIRHESLQVVYLPSYRRLLFSGAIGWHVNVLPHKHSSGSRVEIKLVPDGPHDAACQLLLILVVNTVGGAVGGTAKQREDEIMMSFQETVTTRSITFQAVANGDRFIVGAIVNNHQQTVSFGGKTEFFSTNVTNYTCCGLQVLPTFANNGAMKIPPQSNISFAVPLVTTLMLKRKATL